MIAKRQPYKIIPYPKKQKIGRVIKNPRHQEKEGEQSAAKMMVIIGGDVKFLPELNIPNIKNPDCEWQGTIWEIKTLYGNSKNNTENVIRSAGKQAMNIIVNATRTSRDINRVAIDVMHCLTVDKKISNIKQVLILGKNQYSIIRRSVLK